MSFWEDRFVNRPHSGALEPDPYAASTHDETQGSAYPQLPSSDEPTTWGTSYQRADEIEPIEAVDGDSLALVDEPDVSDENGAEPVVEYRRKGLFRRRRPLAVESVEEDKTDDVDEPGAIELAESPANNPAHDPANDEIWNVVSESEAALEEDSVEADEPQQVEKKKRGLFRRHKPEVVDELSDEVDEASELHMALQAESEPEAELEENPWKVEAVEDEHELVASTEVAEVDEAQPEKKRRGLFRRRKPAVSQEQELDSGTVEDDAFGNVSYWGIEAAHESAEALDEPAPDTEEPQHEEQQEHEEHEVFVFGQQDDAGAEDDQSAADAEMEPEPAHELVAESPDEVPERDASDSEAQPVEPQSVEDQLVEPQLVEPGPVEVYGSDEPETDDPEPVFAEPEVYALDQPAPTDEPHTEPAPSVADPEVFAVDEEPVVEEPVVEEPVVEEHWAPQSEASEEIVQEDELVLEEPALVSETELEHEAVHNEAAADEPGPDEWNAAGEIQFDESPADESPTDESQHDETRHDDSFDDVVAPPAPLKKRNGAGGPRGKKVVGLKVGASQLAAAVVSGSGERQTLLDVARRPLEPGVVVGGELRDTEALVHALRTFFKENHLPTKNVRLGLSSSRVGVRTFEIAGVEDELRFDNAVRFKAHEVLPVAAHESLLDYRVVEEKYTESGEVSRRVLLVVAPRDQVEPYVEACNQAGIRLAGVDLESFGLLRTFVAPFGSRDRTEDSATVVVSIGHEASTLLVAGGGICEFTRVFDWGGDALQNAIADELEVPHMEAATILNHLSLSGPGHHLDSLDAEKRGRALEAVRARLTPFARELVSSLQFYQTQPESLGIREILITGGTAQLEGLADALHQMIGVNVGVGDPLARVEVHTEIPAAIDATIGSLAVPIGLAIEDEPARSVNLLPKDARQTRKKPNALALAVPLAAAIPVAAFAFLFMQASGSASDRQAQLDATRAEIDALPEPKKAIIDPTLAGEQALRATSVAQILGGRLTWERVLGDVSRVLPAGVSLTELVATTPAPTAPVAATPPTTEETTATDGAAAPPPAPIVAPVTPSSVSVNGYALDYPTIARTLERLQAVPSLTNVELQSATPTTRGEKRIITFTIVAVLATPGGVQ